MFTELVISFGAAMIIGYLLGKPVEILSKLIRLRSVSILVIFALFIFLISMVGSFLFPLIAEQLQTLKSSLPNIALKTDKALFSINAFLGNYQIQLPIQHLNANEVVSSLAKYLKLVDFADFGGFVNKFLLGSVKVFAYTLITLVFSFYFLLDGKQLWAIIVSPLSKKHREHANEIKQRIDNTMYSYVTGQFQIALLTTSVMLITYFALKVPYPILLGLAQMLEIIPVLGTWMAIVPCIIIIFILSGGPKALIALIVYLLYTQIVRDYLIAPRIIGHAMGFHPVGIMIALIIGANLAGIAGIILAFPVVALISQFIGYFIEMRNLRQETY